MQEAGTIRIMPAKVMAEGRRPLLPRPADHRAASRTLANATILQIVSSLHDEPAARTAVETACGLMQSGARVLVAGEPGALAGKLQAAGGEWIPLRNDTINPLRLRRNATTLERLIDDERIDVIHAHNAGAAWSALAAAAHLPVWLVMSLPDRPLASGWPRSFYAGALTRGDRIVAPSGYAANHAIEDFDVRPDRIVVVARSVDTRQFDPASIDRRRLDAFRAAARLHPGERAILMRGRITPARGHHVLVEAAALLAEGGSRHCVYVFAGDDESDRSYVRQLTARIGELGLEANFRIGLRCRDMPAALAASHLVVMPALHPPSTGRAAAEAQTMARPVVATAIGLLPERLLAPPRMPDELRTGWLVQPDDAGELADAIGVAMSLDDTAYQALAARARQYAQFVFSPDRVIAATRAVYTALLARDR